jgi:hypothetical protein
MPKVKTLSPASVGLILLSYLIVLRIGCLMLTSGGQRNESHALQQLIMLLIYNNLIINTICFNLDKV